MSGTARWVFAPSGKSCAGSAACTDGVGVLRQTPLAAGSLRVVALDGVME
jgi:hypothetical protein